MAGFALTIEGNVGLPSLDVPSDCGRIAEDPEVFAGVQLACQYS
jgi:hypothetical protein